MNKKCLFKGLLAALGAFLFLSCVGFKGDIPLQTQQEEETYISPANQDGKKDTLNIPLDIPEIKGLRVTGYRFTVTAPQGTIVYLYEESLEETKGLKGLFKKASVDIPDSLIWDGRDSQSNFVPDGGYTWTVEAWDAKGNRGSTDPARVTVDNTPPVGAISLPYTFFSPNNDDRQDTLPVSHEQCSIEDRWTSRIVDAQGTALRTFWWKGIPGNFQWDGTDKAGGALPDGTYGYILSSVDRAENSFETAVQNIIIDTSPVTIDLTVNPSTFSPNGDGILDTVTFSPTVLLQGTKEVAESTITIVNSTGIAVFARAQKDGILGPLEFQGKTVDGKRLPDGDYYGIFSILYRNGDNPRISSKAVTLDTTPPYIVFSADYLLFSPDGDGRKDTLTLFQSSSVEKEWKGEILDARGTRVAGRVWEGKTPSVEWDGMTDNGTLAPDGGYSYRLTCTDEAGNSTVKTLPGIRIDTRPTPVTLLPSTQAFSPNGDGTADDILFHLEPLITEEVLAWSLSIQNSTDIEVRRFIGDGKFIPDVIPWDGRDETGLLTEGFYTARLELEYEKGNLAVDMTKQPILLDVSAPEILVNLGPLPFSPDGDGYNDVLRFDVTLQDESPLRSWNAEILDPYARGFHSFNGSGIPATPFFWNGRSASGELVQSAEDYTLRFTAVDRLGNIGTLEKKIPVDILVLKDGDKLRIVISSIYFKPNTADYLDIEPDKAAKNIQTLDRLAEILKKYGSYNISLEGHAVRVYWNRPDRWLAEENETLLPLSKERAEVIRDALIRRGIVPARMTTFGYGGYQPVVPHGDLDNRWKNRRVEFILSR
ncbi:MAG: gliding motility-associated C-terminal domain-containing protein [Spirochaetales bacterium]|nr:gliding motility-associated C-terminal domain-containing protein [Spirochaetales bacterium]